MKGTDNPNKIIWDQIRLQILSLQKRLTKDLEILLIDPMWQIGKMTETLDLVVKVGVLM